MGFDKILSAAKRAADKLRARRMTSAVILAAGNGTRFMDGEDSEKKQFVLVAGKPAILRTVEAFEMCDDVDEIIVVTGSGDVERCSSILEGRASKLKRVIPGGETRQESAKAGLEAIDPSSEFIAVHDGARCLVTPEIISNVLRGAAEYGAAAAAERAVDTVKYADENGMIEDTIDRSRVWLVKTPQIFLANMYRAGVYMAERDKAIVTDDCMLVERLGFKVKLIDCGSENIKLTYGNDLAFAENVIRRRAALKSISDKR